MLSRYHVVIGLSNGKQAIHGYTPPPKDKRKRTGREHQCLFDFGRGGVLAFGVCHGGWLDYRKDKAPTRNFASSKSMNRIERNGHFHDRRASVRYS